MLKIGDFARLCRVPAKTLRYYDEIGLLKPRVIDRFTRYRYYAQDQAAQLKRILALKELGFSLEEIGRLLQSDPTRQKLQAMLEERRVEIEREMREARRQLILVQARLRQLVEGGDTMCAELHVPTSEKEKEIMEPKIVSLEAFKVVGLPYLGKNEHGEISRLWDGFGPRMGEIAHLAEGSPAAYGLCSPNPQGLVDYVAALAVTALEHIPAGMVGRDVPAQTYGVFEAHGVAEIGPTYRMILNDWLPRSGYRPGDGPDFELYPETFDPQNADTSLLYIYFPIKR